MFLNANRFDPLFISCQIWGKSTILSLLLLFSIRMRRRVTRVTLSTLRHRRVSAHFSRRSRPIATIVDDDSYRSRQAANLPFSHSGQRFADFAGQGSKKLAAKCVVLAVQSIWQRSGHPNGERGRVRQTLPGTEPLAQHPQPNRGGCRHWPVSVCCCAIIVNIPACESHSLRRLLNAGRLSLQKRTRSSARQIHQFSDGFRF